METKRKHHALEADRPGVLGELIADLMCDDEAVRARAVHELVLLGRAASDALVEALNADRAEIRWQGALALRSIADPATAPALLDALEDEDVGVRWLAAEALCAIGGPAVRPLLERLTHSADSVLLREGAEHVLRSLLRGGLGWTLRPVLQALEYGAPETSVPVAAYHALRALRRRKIDVQASSS